MYYSQNENESKYITNRSRYEKGCKVYGSQMLLQTGPGQIALVSPKVARPGGSRL